MARAELLVEHAPLPERVRYRHHQMPHAMPSWSATTQCSHMMMPPMVTIGAPPPPQICTCQRHTHALIITPCVAQARRRAASYFLHTLRITFFTPRPRRRVMRPRFRARHSSIYGHAAQRAAIADELIFLVPAKMRCAGDAAGHDDAHTRCAPGFAPAKYAPPRTPTRVE